MIEEHDYPKLARYFTGECTEQEEVEISAWINSDPARRAEIDTLRSLWSGAGKSRQQWDTTTAWQQVVVRKGKNKAKTPVFWQSPMWATALRAAAVFLLVLAPIVFWRMSGQSQKERPLRTAREVITVRGQRATVKLADGSTVILGPESRLRESPSFGVNNREVYLEGEGYFEAVHDPSKPFLVRTPRAVAHDIGTKFVVRAYTDRQPVDVVVTEGSVALKAVTAFAASKTSSTSDSLILKASELGRLDTAGSLHVKHNVAIDDYVAWTTGRLVFTNTPLRDVLPRLSRWYDVDVRLGDATLANYEFSASLQNEPVSRVLDLLAATVGGRIERQGNTVTLYQSNQNR